MKETRPKRQDQQGQGENPRDQGQGQDHHFLTLDTSKIVEQINHQLLVITLICSSILVTSILD